MAEFITKAFVAGLGDSHDGLRNYQAASLPAIVSTGFFEIVCRLLRSLDPGPRHPR